MFYWHILFLYFIPRLGILLQQDEDFTGKMLATRITTLFLMLREETNLRQFLPTYI